jgi:alginate O-acetyltransferase complex protein AlgJ
METAPRKNARQTTQGPALLVGLFFGLLWLPLVATTLGLNLGAPTSENRALAPPPPLEWSEQAVKEFPRRFEAWYDDHFGFRDTLVRQYHRAHFGWLGIADPEKVVKGKSDWLYLGRSTLIDEARGLNPAAEADIGAWVERLDAIRTWQEDRGGEFLLVLVPDKHRVYPEYLPNWFTPSVHRRKEQLTNGLAPNGMEVLDLTDAMVAAKDTSVHPIWLKSDTHWTGAGAYHGYRAILGELGRVHAAQDELSPADSPPVHDGAWHNTGNLAGLLGVRDLISESWVGLLPPSPRAVPTERYPSPSRRVSGVNVPFATEIPDPALPTAMVIGGSFRWALVPLLSEHFRRTLYTDFRYCFFDEELAVEEAPDVILFVMTERQLLWFPTPPAESRW